MAKEIIMTAERIRIADAVSYTTNDVSNVVSSEAFEEMFPATWNLLKNRDSIRVAISSEGTTEV